MPFDKKAERMLSVSKKLEGIRKLGRDASSAVSCYQDLTELGVECSTEELCDFIAGKYEQAAHEARNLKKQLAERGGKQ